MKKAALRLCVLLAGSAISPLAAEELQKSSIVVFGCAARLRRRWRPEFLFVQQR
jgi:hypothetical protein